MISQCSTWITAKVFEPLRASKEVDVKALMLNLHSKIRSIFDAAVTPHAMTVLEKRTSMTDARRSGTIIALAFAGVVGSQTQSNAAIWLTTCWMPAEGRLSSDSSFDAAPIP